MKRGSRTAVLLGPYWGLAQAEAKVGDGRRLAETVDLFTHFDFFGVMRYEAATLPKGVLNDRLKGEGE